jgi:hypothetical protein
MSKSPSDQIRRAYLTLVVDETRRSVTKDSKEWFGKVQAQADEINKTQPRAAVPH